MLAAGVSVWVILPLAVAIYYFLTVAGRLKVKNAVQLLSEGALLLDVRSPEEYDSNAVEGSINLPLQTLEIGAKKHLKDKNKVLICFCLSGARSNSAVGRLRRMGYTAYNIGGVSRAHRIVSMLSESD